MGKEDQGSFRCAAEGAPQPFSQRPLSAAQPEAPGATHQVLQRDIPKQWVQATKKSDRRWTAITGGNGKVQSQGQSPPSLKQGSHFNISQQQSKQLRFCQAMEERESGT